MEKDEMAATILILDDDPSIRMLYAEELTDEGYQVMTCGDGSDLMEQIREMQPDLIVMDIRLRGENGLDLLQGIKNAYSNLPVILCSAHPAFKEDMNSIAADYYVSKSSNMGELKSTIEGAIKGRPCGEPATVREPLRQPKQAPGTQSKIPY